MNFLNGLMTSVFDVVLSPLEVLGVATTLIVVSGVFGSAPDDHVVTFVRDGRDCDSYDRHARNLHRGRDMLVSCGQVAHMCCRLKGSLQHFGEFL